MPEVLKSLSNNPMLSLVGFGLAVLSLILAIIFYLRSQKNKSPCYEVSNNTIIQSVSKSLEGLEIVYHGKPQERITVTKIALWNDGRGTIDRSDLVARDQLRIELSSDVEVLNVQIVESSSDAIEAELLPKVVGDGKLVYPITFEYLDHRDFFVIQIVHTAIDTTSIVICGKIKGVKDITRAIGQEAQERVRSLPFISALSNPYLLHPKFMRYFGSILFLYISTVFVSQVVTEGSTWYRWLIAVVSLLFAWIMFYGYRRNAPIKI